MCLRNWQDGNFGHWIFDSRYEEFTALHLHFNSLKKKYLEEYDLFDFGKQKQQKGERWITKDTKKFRY